MAPVGDRIANEAVPESERRGRQPGGCGSAAPEGRVTARQAPPAGPGASQAKGELLVGADRAVREGPAGPLPPHPVSARATRPAVAIASCRVGCRDRWV